MVKILPRKNCENHRQDDVRANVVFLVAMMWWLTPSRVGSFSSRSVYFSVSNYFVLIPKIRPFKLGSH